MTRIGEDMEDCEVELKKQKEELEEEKEELEEEKEELEEEICPIIKLSDEGKLSYGEYIEKLMQALERAKEKYCKRHGISKEEYYKKLEIYDEECIEQGCIKFDPLCDISLEEKEHLKKILKPIPDQIITIYGKEDIPK